jgi:phenylacetate-CoA ligase
MHLPDDLVIVEPVDQAGRPVPPGTRSDKLDVTAVTNPLLPLIRLKLTGRRSLRRGPRGRPARAAGRREGP